MKATQEPRGVASSEAAAAELGARRYITHALSFELMMKFVHSGGLSWEPHQTVQLLEVAIDFQVVVVLARCPVAASS